MSSQVPDLSSTTYTNLSAPAIGEPPTLLASQLSPKASSSPGSFSVQFPNLGAAQYESHPQITNMLSSMHQSQIQPPPTRKRKAPTMSVKNWKPAENRIKELWIDEKKSLEDLQDIVNREFGFTANVRQYKGQIKKMKLEKNAKEDERRPIVRHLKYRERKGKKIKKVRVRGHEITPAKMTRWKKEQASPPPLLSPSPLPSYISVLTGSPSGSPATLPYASLPNKQAESRSDYPTDGFNETLQKLFDCATDESVTSQEARPLFNALQLILGCERRTLKHQKLWDAFTEESITHFRNLRGNMPQKIDVHREWNREWPFAILLYSTEKMRLVAHEDGFWSHETPRRFDRHAFWWTAYGIVRISFATRMNVSHYESWHQENSQPMNEVLATRITFIPKPTLSRSFAAVFDFNPGHDPYARITYQATIPKHSLIFQLVSAGDVYGLIQMLQDGSGRLTDRDEKGRSLLNYSLQSSRVSMTKFLLQNGQDPNSIELHEFGHPDCLLSMGAYNHFEMPAKERNESTECHKLMLEAGADFSLVSPSIGYNYGTGLELAIEQCHELTLERVLDLGLPFVSPNTEYLSISSDKKSPLSTLARRCGYVYSTVIQVVDKAILLLKRGADIAYRDANGDTVLHTSLSSNRAYRENRLYFERSGQISWDLETRRFFFSLTEPKTLLIVFLAAGADVYAVNKDGKTPSSVAKQHGLEDEWNEALTACGYSYKEVLAYPKLGPFGHAEKRQSSRLSFEDVCRQRQEYLNFKEQFFEEHCRACGEPFSPSLISVNEECGQCREKFRYKEEQLDSQYESLREQYLQEKDNLTQYRRRREQSSNEEVLRYKRAFYDEHCRDCGFQFQPKLSCLPERCLQCGAKIGVRRGPIDACFEKIAAEYAVAQRRYNRDIKMSERRRHKNLDGDEKTDWSEDTTLDHVSDLDSHINSDEAGHIKISPSIFTTSDEEMADPNLTEGLQAELNQMNLQAMDNDMNTNPGVHNIAWIASLPETLMNNQVDDAAVNVVTNATAEKPLSQIPSVPADGESLSLHSHTPADLNTVDEFFNYDEYFKEA